MTDTDILTDLSAPALAAAVRANLYSFFLCGERAPAMEFARCDGFVRWYLPHPLPLFHGALSTRDAAPGDEEAVDEALAYYRGKRAGAVCWWLEDGVGPAGWARLLESRGFSLAEGPPGMAVDLAALPPGPAQSGGRALPPGAEVHVVRDAGEMRAFVDVVTAVFGFPPEAGGSVYEWELAVGMGSGSTCYLATLDGVPVGTSQVLLAAGVAGIYNVGVEEDVRGRGLGAALTLRPLLEARAAGYRAGVLQSSDSGLPLYLHLGFEHYGRLGYYALELGE